MRRGEILFGPSASLTNYQWKWDKKALANWSPQTTHFIQIIQMKKEMEWGKPDQTWKWKSGRPNNPWAQMTLLPTAQILCIIELHFSPTYLNIPHD